MWNVRPLITNADDRRLRTLLATERAPGTTRVRRLLREKLDAAAVIACGRMPASIVTMNSRVACWDEDAREMREVTLVYPWHAAPSARRISVLSEEGVRLLGALPGQVVRIDGTLLKIVYVAYQPEASGHAHL